MTDSNSDSGETKSGMPMGLPNAGTPRLCATSLNCTHLSTLLSARRGTIAARKKMISHLEHGLVQRIRHVIERSRLVESKKREGF